MTGSMLDKNKIWELVAFRLDKDWFTLRRNANSQNRQRCCKNLHAIQGVPFHGKIRMRHVVCTPKFTGPIFCDTTNSDQHIN